MVFCGDRLNPLRLSTQCIERKRADYFKVKILDSLLKNILF